MRNVSNNMIAPSISQMLRSSVVVFAAILAVIFLKSKLYKHHYVSILAIIIGLAFVGLSTALKPSDEKNDRTGSIVLLGIIL